MCITGYNRQQGIILKKLPYGDADEIITVLLKEEGLQRFFVTGSRKSKKRYQGLIDHFNHLCFYYTADTKGLLRLHKAESLGSAQSIPDRGLKWFCLAHYLTELISALTPEAARDHDLYPVWLDFEGRAADQDFGLDGVVFFVLKVLEKTGYGIDLHRCVNCNNRDLTGQVVFDSVKGGIKCGRCCQSGDGGVVGYDLKHLQSLANNGASGETQPRHSQVGNLLFLKQLVLFSENIVQKKSRAADFMLQVFGGH
ncbi:MAG: DNA repair protein RecO [Deltaproteobacteria bacterium]|nr:DNA repair protein RecO [Deltaproteobacteria bacterium]